MADILNYAKNKQIQNKLNQLDTIESKINNLETKVENIDESTINIEDITGGSIYVYKNIYDKTKFLPYKQWIQKTSGATPRYSHSAIHYNDGQDKMIIFGGYNR